MSFWLFLIWNKELSSFLGLHLINAMRRCSKLIVGRIHGKAVGGGVGIASACDYALLLLMRVSSYQS
jgi:enoyl-CoA hydratase/carnithine racemase